MWVHWGSEQQEELRYQLGNYITYHTHVPSRGNCYTHSVELVVG